MPECHDIDALMIDWLYEELEDAKSASFNEHVDGCSRCRAELDSLSQTRAALRELPDEEPPKAVSAILLHEAAKRVPSDRKRAVTSEESLGLLAWLNGLFQPLVRHPAATAIATLVLVAGVAGSLYMRGDVGVETPTTASNAPAPRFEASNEAPRGAAAGVGEGTIATEDGYYARLADQGDTDLSINGLSASRTVPAQDPNVTIEQEAGSAEADRWADGKRGDLARRLSERKTKGKKKLPPRKGRVVDAPVTTNAVSGADLLVDDDEAQAKKSNKDLKLDLEKNKRQQLDFERGGEATGAPRGGSGGKADNGRRGGVFDKRGKATPSRDAPPTPAKPAATRQPSTPAPTDSSGRYRAYNSKKEIKWAQNKERSLSKALKAQRCRDAAKIANDILDRNPSYYYKQVGQSKSIKRCTWYVKDETRRRARNRTKARSKGGGVSKKAKAKAAPAEADMAEPASE